MKSSSLVGNCILSILRILLTFTSSSRMTQNLPGVDIPLKTNISAVGPKMDPHLYKVQQTSSQAEWRNIDRGTAEPDYLTTLVTKQKPQKMYIGWHP